MKNQTSLELLLKRKKEALKNAEKFKDNAFSFIKLSNNIQEEIEILQTKAIDTENITFDLQNNIYTKKNTYHNSIDENKELDEYIKIYLQYNFIEHYEINEYITKNDLWDKFPNIRSLNDYGDHKAIKGILPKFYAQVCERLNIEGAGGLPLDRAVRY